MTSLALSGDEQLLRETARAFVIERTPVAELRRLRDSGDPLGFSRPVWEEMAALGWAGLPFPESVGGAGAGVFAAGVVAEELGRQLAPTPLLSTVLAGTCLAGASTPAAEKLLAEMIEGRAIVALAVMDGHTSRFVIDGRGADHFVISADDRLFLVGADAPGVTVTSAQLVDSRFYATVRLDNVVPQPDAGLGGRHVLEQALDRGTAVLAAEMVGLMSRALELTVEHLRQRLQFDVPIGSFQALQHRAARMYVAVEQARSVVADALRGLDEGADDAALRVSTAKAMVNDAARLVTGESVQMHGGMGITDEADIGLYLKRARLAEVLLGDSAFHRRRFAGLSGF